MLSIGIVGCGLIGRKRAEALKGLAFLVLCNDFDKQVSQKFATDFDCNIAETFEQMLDDENIDVVFIATRHDSLGLLAIQALNKGKNVFIEKPGAINQSVLREVQAVALERGLHVYVGYNHRYHRAIRKAIFMANSGDVGKILFLRARYGHGGRIGYDKEWRADKTKSGGGELIDQGTHLLDLCKAFLGDLKLEYGATPTYFWKMPVEDNAFVVVKNSSGAIGFLHASCTEWKNLFSLEVYGEFGKLEINGLGGSYGTEKLTFFKMLPEMGPPETTTWDFPMQDDSWEMEVKGFIEDIENGTAIMNNLDSAIEVLDLVNQIYMGSEQ
jgi:predicted dehydrogenase